MIAEFKNDLVRKLGIENLKKIEKVRIGIAGAGGLGSNCALNLVRVGFKKFTIVDFDVVEASNLDRQFYFADQIGKNKVEALKENLLRINSELELEVKKNKIEKENVGKLFKDCEIVVECFDKAEYKSMIVEEMLLDNKFIVSVSGVGGIGNSDEIKIKKIKENFIVVGDLKSDIQISPALSPRVIIAAAKQADVILEYVLKKLDKNS